MMDQGHRSPNVSLVFGALLLLAACAPRAKAAEVPSLKTVCEHSASLTSQGTNRTKEDEQQICEANYAGYPEEGEAVRWSCRSSCYMAATTKDDLERCDERCAVPTPKVSCRDVFRESDMSDAFRLSLKAGVPQKNGGPLEAGDWGPVDQSNSCGGWFESRELEVMVRLYWQRTQAGARRFAKANETRSNSSRGECMELVHEGTFVLTLSSDRRWRCDRDGMKRALDRARQHLTPP